MLNNDFYYFGLMRKYQTIFGNLFNDMIIERTIGANTTPTQIINVPLHYAEKEKMLTRVTADPNINRQDAVLLPALSYFMDAFQYSGGEMRSKVQKFTFSPANNAVNFQYTEVPWDFGFTLWIYVKYTEDANKILEQIVPFFTPQFTVRAYLVPGRPSVDIPISIKSVSHSYTEGPMFKDRELLIWELNFVLKGFFYPPIWSAPVIDVINTNVYDGVGPIFNIANNTAFGVSSGIGSYENSNGSYAYANGGIPFNPPPPQGIPAPESQLYLAANGTLFIGGNGQDGGNYQPIVSLGGVCQNVLVKVS